MNSNVEVSAKPRWTVVGQGAIGLLAACQAQLHHWPVALWLRQPQVVDINFQQLNQQQSQHHFVSWPLDTAITHIFIAVKAFDVEACLQQLQPHLSPEAHIVLSHNGMGTLDSARSQLLPQQQLWFASTTHGAYKPAPDQLIHSGAGQSVIATINAPIQAPSHKAPRQHRPESVTSFMADALGPLTEVTAIEPYLWQKLAINCLINPITALHHIRNGDLAQAKYHTQLQQLLKEVCLVAAAEGVPLQEHDCWQQVQQVIKNTAANVSSMLQDRQAGRPTELEFISGFILRKAQRHQLQLPAHTKLYQQCQDAGF
ncbi:2-dehydropantoate 2-reductase [Alkalimonas collagenimarina]|uniref:2-dehydropantoate 2-reductase n=1 Tax=Alkalimonas collagenimarina TaxID=400390 RepID=A0ABT9GU72_9GAMM|nr:2-dehydropantoate 2-reductase [Alkalimonas collagenimarina]MDP4534603.1 2-dehydropantoate 2-reductase [Alkalimonas collagenimarina]